MIQVGHNIENFDLPVICNSPCRVKLFEKFASKDSGCIDTLFVAKKFFDKDKVSNYKQENLVHKFLQQTYEAHNAIADVKSLSNLYHEKYFASVLKQPAFYVFSVYAPLIKKELKLLVEEKTISSDICKKLGRNGIF